jgi:hypothetical protein
MPPFLLHACMQECKLSAGRCRWAEVWFSDWPGKLCFGTRTYVLLWFGAVVGDFGLSQILMAVEMVCANVRTKRQPLFVLPLRYRAAILMHVQSASPNSWQTAEIYTAAVANWLFLLLYVQCGLSTTVTKIHQDLLRVGLSDRSVFGGVQGRAIKRSHAQCGVLTRSIDFQRFLSRGSAVQIRPSHCGVLYLIESF